MLSAKTSLKIILLLSVLGMLFSGYLSYTELFSNVCTLGCSKVGSVPACVYGFVMYFIVFVVGLLGLRK